MVNLKLVRKPSRKEIAYTGVSPGFTGGSDPLSAWIRTNHSVNQEADNLRRLCAADFTTLNDNVDQSWSEWQGTDATGADSVGASVREI